MAQLYGGALRERVPAYASGIPHDEGVDPETYWVEDAWSLAAAGFRAIKVRIGRHAPAPELPLLARMRAELPGSVVRTPIRIDPADGMVVLPTGPGLGVDIDEDVLHR